MPDRKFLIRYFVVFGVLAALAQVPTFVFLAMVLTSGIVGFPMIAAATVLLYSAALLPAWNVAVTPGRSGQPIVVALLIPIAIAVVPGALSLSELHQEAAHRATEDFTKPAAGRPRSVELIGDEDSGLFVNGAGDQKAACGDVCRRLLFNREIENVRVTKRSVPSRNGPANVIGSASYRIERRESCPEAYPEGSRIDTAVRDRIIAGDCLVASAAADGRPPEATLSLLTLHDSQLRPLVDLPWIASIKLIRRLRIEQLERAHATAILQRTEIQGEPLALPFYFGYDFQRTLADRTGSSLAAWRARSMRSIPSMCCGQRSVSNSCPSSRREPRMPARSSTAFCRCRSRSKRSLLSNRI
jgi:hypothetical protein